ncbi:MAG: riboflavin synthase [Bacteroidetes bacterium]|nr:riboflavin synthase [Bacteroidota bacterium]MBL0016560.1 riboflavin synthase [Bacteroidota bacterium]MBP6722968.1 riboflavin synthase [Bacteroidia bacterium]
MFTGIIESTGRLISRKSEGSNIVFRIATVLDEPIKVDQSIAHNGVCLTVTEIFENIPEGNKEYTVVAVEETLKKTNLGSVQAGDIFNIERCLKAGQRMDGHFVQGHVDTTGLVTGVKDVDGSWMFHFSFPAEFSNLMVDKGSICVNGVSLTVVESGTGHFSVTIIPYTYEHTNFHAFKVGDQVNLEFDILGKYLHKIYGPKD